MLCALSSPKNKTVLAYVMRFLDDMIWICFKARPLVPLVKKEHEIKCPQLSFYNCRTTISNVRVKNIGKAGIIQWEVVRTVITSKFFGKDYSCFKIKSTVFYIRIE